MEHAHRGENAIAAGKFEEAISHYTAALAQSPSSPPYYIKRSTAFQRIGKHKEALEDAEIAVVLATKRAKRELIGQAQLRRGIAFFNLERFGDAGKALEFAKKYDSSDKSLGIWEAKVKTKLKSLSDEDEKGKSTIVELPLVQIPDSKAVPKQEPKDTVVTPQEGIQQSTPKIGVQTPVNQIRHEWYQNNDSVFVSLFAKGVPKDSANIDVQAQSLSISFPLPSGSNFDFSLEPLYAAIDVEKSSFKVLSTKIEVTLKKSVSAQKWNALEASAPLNDVQSDQTSTLKQDHPSKQNEQVSTKASGPEYPTSSRSGPKNWDKIVQSYAAPAGKPKSKSDDAELDDGGDAKEYIDDFEEGDEVNNFFKKLYADADPNTRRAMMKSYQESGGTALSTNWEDVKKAPVPISPPDGMVAKKWGE